MFTLLVITLIIIKNLFFRPSPKIKIDCSAESNKIHKIYNFIPLTKEVKLCVLKNKKEIHEALYCYYKSVEFPVGSLESKIYFSIRAKIKSYLGLGESRPYKVKTTSDFIEFNFNISENHTFKNIDSVLSTLIKSEVISSSIRFGYNLTFRIMKNEIYRLSEFEGNKREFTYCLLLCMKFQRKVIFPRYIKYMILKAFFFA
jgi:hypothetical protein